jgi:hypothetical protein
MHDENALTRTAEPAWLDAPPRDHNGGPPLDDPPDHVPEWGPGGIGNYFDWRRACRDAWKPVPRETMLRRLKKAEQCGLTYGEYSLVLLETGRHVQPCDTDLIAQIIARR